MGMSSKLNQIIMIPFPRCLHRISCVHLPTEDDDMQNKSNTSRTSNQRQIKIIKSNGVVEIYDKPMRAQELMQEFPKHLICRSDTFYIGQKTPALSNRDRLQLGHNYFLLPANFFQSALSFAAVIRCQMALSGGARTTSFDVEKTPSGGLRIKVFEDVIFQKKEETVEEEIGGLCSTPKLRREYEMLVGQRRHWKPKLDTIVEQKTQKTRTKKR